MSSEESLFREVDEDVRRDQLANLWKRYGNAIIAVSLGIILAVAAIKGWQFYQQSQAEAAAREYVAAARLENENKQAEAAKAFAAMGAGQGGFAAIARMREAANLAASGDVTGAVKAYDEVSATAAAELADAARVRAAWLLVDTAPAADLEKRLSGMMDAGNAWRNAAREILGLAWYRGGDLNKADTLFGELLGDAEAPPSARARAQLMLQLIAPRLGAKTAG